MKKFIIIIAALVALGFSIWGYYRMKSATVSQNTDIFISLPENAFSILKINNLQNFSDALLYNNNYWRDLAKINDIGDIHYILSTLDSLKESSPEINSFMENRKLMISTYVDSSANFKHLISTQISASEWTTVQNFMHTYVKKTFYFCYENEIFIASSNRELLDASKQQIKSKIAIIKADSAFTQISASSGTKATANWFLDMKQSKKLINRFFQSDITQILSITKDYDSWCCFDLDLSEDKIIINGFADGNGKNDIIHIFQGQTTNSNTLSSVMPYNTYFFRHYAISDFGLFQNKLAEYREALSKTAHFAEESAKWETTSGESPLLFFQEYFGGEIALACNPTNTYIIAKLYNQAGAQDRLTRMVEETEGASSNKKGTLTIFHFPLNGFAGNIFGEYFNLDNEYISVVGDNLIIAPTEDLLSYIASRNKNTQTLQCSPEYKRANKTLLSTSNRTIYVDIPYIIRNSEKFFVPEIADKIKSTRSLWSNFESLGFQSEAESNGNDYQHIFVQYDKKSEVEIQEENKQESQSNENIAQNENSNISVAATQPVDENTSKFSKLISIELDKPARIKPQFVINHYTGETEIAIQDEKNQFYLINSEGKILWKIQLPEAIIGDITQVDMLKNKKLQMAFTTLNKLYIIDRTGKNLKSYPKNLPSRATAGLSVFDYDNKRDYRFFIPTENKQINLIKADGTTPQDWKFKESSGKIKQAIKFYRVNGKDYLVASDAKQCYFLDRRGRNRLIPKKNIIPSANNLIYIDDFSSQKRFVMSSPDGTIVYLHQDGNVLSIKTTKRDKNHAFVVCKSKQKTYYAFYDTQGFTLYDTELESIIEDNTVNSGKSPKCETYNNYIGIYDSDQEKIFVYNSDIPNQKIAIASDNDLFFICQYKPHEQTCIAYCNENKLLLAKIE